MEKISNYIERQEIPSGEHDTYAFYKDWIPAYLQINHVPGMVVGIQGNSDEILWDGFGVQDVSTQETPTAHTRFRIGSLSKVFTGIAILQLVQEGTISLDDPINQSIPELKKASSDITIKTLLTHTSGIRRDSFSPSRDIYGDMWMEGVFPSREEFIQEIKERGEYQDGSTLFPVPPNEKFKYSSFGYTLLGLIIENKTNDTYNNFVQENIIKPLQLSHTTPDYFPEIDMEMAIGYGKPPLPGEERLLVSRIPADIFAPSAGYISTIRDVSTLIKAHLTKHPILKSHMWDAVNTTYVTKDNRNRTLLFDEQNINRSRYLTHAGGILGYKSMIYINPEEKSGMVLLANTHFIDMQGLAKGMIRVKDFFEQEPALDTTNTAFNQDLSRYRGPIHTQWGYDALFPTRKGHLLQYDQRHSDPMSSLRMLIPVGENKFHRGEEGKHSYAPIGELASVIFDANGKPLKLVYP